MKKKGLGTIYQLAIQTKPKLTAEQYDETIWLSFLYQVLREIIGIKKPAMV